jgi:hypothetical protein
VFLSTVYNTSENTAKVALFWYHLKKEEEERIWE